MNLNLTFINVSVLIFLVLFYFIGIRSKKIFKYRTIIFLILFIPLLFYTFGDNLSAKWWIIDDHEIFHYLTKSNDSESYNGIWFIDSLIHKTEIGLFGNYPRYRLSYFSLRILEAYLFQDSAFYYYALRLIFILYFFYTLFLLVSRYLGVALGIGTILLVFSETYWSDIFSRLGPGEWYCLIGISFILHTFSKTNNLIKFTFLQNLVLSLSIIIAAGSKENFFILIFLSVYIVYRNWINRQKNYIVIVSLLPIIFIIFSILPLGIFFLKNPHDMYGNSTRLSDRLFQFVPFLQSSFFLNSLWISFIALSSFCVLIFKKEIPIIINQNKKLIYLISCLIVIFLFNVIFYNSKWPTNSRYDFPGFMVYQLMNLFSLILFFNYLFHFLNLKRNFRILIRNTILICIISLSINFNNVDKLKEASQSNKKRTSEFTNFLNHFVKDVNLNNLEIVYLINRGEDLEPLASFTRYLNYYKINQKNSIIVANKVEETDHQNRLLDAMKAFSLNGNEEYKIKPLNFQDLNISNCFILIFAPSKQEDFQNKNICKNSKIEIVPW